MRYAIVIDGIVDNLIAWDSNNDWQPPMGSILVHLEDNEWCDIGCQYLESNTPRFVAAGE